MIELFRIFAYTARALVFMVGFFSRALWELWRFRRAHLSR